MNDYGRNYPADEPKRRKHNLFPPLSEAERAAILSQRQPTRCPPARVAVTFVQNPSRMRNFA